jgi:hypothetical protein
VAVHERHLELVLEVRVRPKAPQDHAGPDFVREVDDQAVERRDGDAGEVAERALQHVETLVEREGAALPEVPRDGHDQLREHTSPAMNQVQVPVRDRVEARGKERLARSNLLHPCWASDPTAGRGVSPAGTYREINVSP